MIIGISGYMLSGKDTVGQMIVDLTMQKSTNVVSNEFGDPMTDTKGNYVTLPDYPRFTIKKFAGKLKQVASLMTGVPVEKFEDQDFKASKMGEEWGGMTYREFLQKLGTDAIRHHVHENSWVNSAMAGYTEDKNWIFTDCRFPNEAQVIKDKGGVIIRVNRYPPGCSPAFMNRGETEVSLDDWKFDHVIYNLGTLDDLKNQIKEILRKINQVNLVTT